MKKLTLKYQNRGLYYIKYTDSAGNETVVQKLIELEEEKTNEI